MESMKGSLAVPSVKELARVLETVPSRYMLGVDDLLKSDDQLNVFSAPVIDMLKLATRENQKMELLKLHNACRYWGMFHLINHGVPKDVLCAMKQKTKEFFDLPLKNKQAYAKDEEGLEGFGQHFVLSEKQKLEWCDIFFLTTFPTHARNLRFWPQDPPNYSETIEAYSEEMRRVATCLTGFLAMGLGLPLDTFSNTFEEGEYQLRLNCYPKCPQPETVLGVNSHTDVGGLTLLLDCGDVAALQVLKDDQWVSVEPRADALVVNVANILEILSNGKYKAPYHRVLVNKSKERLSIATFCYPSAKTDIGPAQELIQKGSPALYKTLTLTEYLQEFFEWKLGLQTADYMNTKIKEKDEMV